MRGRMNDVKSYVPPFQLGEPMQGGAVGKVVESRSPHFSEGETVFHMLGWREAAAAPAQMFNKVPGLPVEDHQWLGNLGLTGATAYFGLLRVAEAKEGDVVFVSAAAGAVGSAVVQIAKAKGMKVIGSAGGADKAHWVRELGADVAIDYKAGPVVKQLTRRRRAARHRRHRRLFRQCRRRPSRRRLRHRQTAAPASPSAA